MNDLKLIFSKLSSLENPAKIVKIVWQLDSLMKKQKTDYPKPTNNVDLYVMIGDEIYQLEKKKLIQKSSLPKEANLMMISKVAFDNILKVMQVPANADVNQFLRAVRKEKSLQKYQEIINELSDSFLTNLSMKELIKIGRKQVI